MSAMPSSDSPVQSKILVLLQKKIEKLGEMLALGRDQKEAISKNALPRLGQVIAERMRCMGEVDSLDKRLADLLACHKRGQDSHLNLFQSKPIKAMVDRLRKILQGLSELEDKSILDLEEQLASVRAQLIEVQKSRIGARTYAPIKSAAARFVDLQG